MTMFELRDLVYAYTRESDLVFKATSLTNYREFARFEGSFNSDEFHSSVYLSKSSVWIRIHQYRPINVELTPNERYNIHVRHADVVKEGCCRVPYTIARIEIPDTDTDADTDDHVNDEAAEKEALLDDYEVRSLFDNLKSEIRSKLDKALNKLLDTEKWLNDLDASVQNIEQMDLFNKKFEKDFLKK